MRESLHAGGHLVSGRHSDRQNFFGIQGLDAQTTTPLVFYFFLVLFKQISSVGWRRNEFLFLTLFSIFYISWLDTNENTTGRRQTLSYYYKASHPTRVYRCAKTLESLLCLLRMILGKVRKNVRALTMSSTHSYVHCLASLRLGGKDALYVAG